MKNEGQWELRSNGLRKGTSTRWRKLEEVVCDGEGRGEKKEECAWKGKEQGKRRRSKRGSEWEAVGERRLGERRRRKKKDKRTGMRGGGEKKYMTKRMRKRKRRRKKKRTRRRKRRKRLSSKKRAG